MSTTLQAKFAPGRIVIAPAALKLLTARDIQLALDAHCQGDWGDLGPEDREENDKGVAMGRRVLSVYHNQAGVRFWLITEADRSVTNVFLRETQPTRADGSLLQSKARSLVKRLNKLTARPIVNNQEIKLRFCIR